jgi:response regulator of citrate/malate metabolism
LVARVGAFDYVMKPVDLDYLTQALEIAGAMRSFDL